MYTVAMSQLVLHAARHSPAHCITSKSSTILQKDTRTWKNMWYNNDIRITVWPTLNSTLNQGHEH